MTAVKIHENNIFTAIGIGSCILLAFLSLAGLLLKSPKFAASILSGGILALANFYWLHNIMKRALALNPGQARRFALLRYLVRLSLIALATYLLIVRFNIDIIGLIIGLSLLVIIIAGLSFYMLTAKGD